MARINNSDTIKQLIRAAQLQVGNDKVPVDLTPNVYPCVEVNPELMRRSNIVANASRSTTGTSTVYTAPTDKDFYLVGIQFSFACDATADSTAYTVSVTGDEFSSTSLIRVVKLTTTADSKSVTWSFPAPIKLKQGQTITVNQTFTAGASTVSATIVGYTVENIKG